jgi:hypothetical protein
MRHIGREALELDDSDRTYAQTPHIVGTNSHHWCQLNVSWAVETAATQTKPACAGFKTLEFLLVRAGGLGFYRRDFQSPWLKLTPMIAIRPYRWWFNGNSA